MLIDGVLLALAWSLALLARPWRLVRSRADVDRFLSPTLACLVLLPWLWSVPRMATMPLPVQLSGACLVALMLGWPIAVLALTAITALSALIVPSSPQALLGQLVWSGIVPASLALGVGIALRRWIGMNPFLYILGRGFLGTAVAIFVASVIHSLLLPAPTLPTALPSHVAHWLMAWGDAFMTGMFAAIFVAYRPQWLATWSDRLYLGRRP
ncbi:MAG: energy-coupling factor ABC transporter permease [Lautropia sp.]